MSDAPAVVPALGYSITANLAGEKQIVFQCYVGQDEDDAAVNAKLDRVIAFVDRLKARAELPDLRDELSKHEKTVAQFDEDRAKLDNQFRSAAAIAELKIKTLVADKEKMFAAAEAQFRKDGRVGDFNPTGHTRTNLDRQDAGIKAIEDEIEAMRNQRAIEIENVDISRRRFQQEIDRLLAKIAEREKVT